MADPVADYLQNLNTSDRVRAAAWDAAYVTDDTDAQRRLAQLPFSDQVRADIWDLRSGASVASVAPQTATAEQFIDTSAPVARTWTDTAVDAIPAVGGTLGGIAGGIGGTVFGAGVGGVPGALGGSALGGAAGEAARQLVNRARGANAPASSAEAAMGIGREAAVQGVSELAGRGVMKGARMAGHGLMDFAIRPAPTVAEEFGDIAATALRERLPVGGILPGATKGSQLAKTAMRGSAANTNALLDTASAVSPRAGGGFQGGVRFTASQIGDAPVQALATDIAKQPLSSSELAQVSNMFTQYLSEHPGLMTPASVKEMKQAAQRIAKPIFKALNSGNTVPAGESLKANFNKAIADGSKEALETIPGVGASEARTQGLIGASRAIRRAEVRRLPLAAELAAPVAGGIAGGATGGDASSRTQNAATGVTAALLTRALLSPRSTSRGALALTEPQIQQALRQMPRAAVYALLDDLQQR